MLIKEFRWSDPNQPTAEVFAVYEVTHDFYREVQHREEFEQYCAWYRRVAQQHQMELQQMRRDINILGWLNGRKSKNG